MGNLTRAWESTGSKTCRMCMEVLSVHQFYPRADRAGYESRCKACSAKRCAEYNRRHRAKNKAAFDSGNTPQVAVKRCSVCKKDKGAESFGVSRSAWDGRNPVCRECANHAAKTIWNPRRKLSDPNGRHGAIWTKYRLRPTDYADLRIRQQDACAVCNETFVRTPHVDHCHRTGIVRGLLCGSCNALMAALDRPGYLEAAQQYLATVADRCGWIQKKDNNVVFTSVTADETTAISGGNRLAGSGG